MTLVLNFLVFGRISINHHLLIFIALAHLILKYGLTSLNLLTLTMFFLESIGHLIDLAGVSDLLLAFELLHDAVLDDREALVLLIPLLGRIYLVDLPLELFNFCLPIIRQVELLFDLAHLLFRLQIVQVLLLFFGAHLFEFTSQAFERLFSVLRQVSLYEFAFFVHFGVVDDAGQPRLVIIDVLLIVASLDLHLDVLLS